MSIGIPCKVMHEAEGHVVTIELKTGETYRGKLIEVSWQSFSFHFLLEYLTVCSVQAEDNMNSQLQDVTFTARDGRVGKVR
jgi:small nuclear ribonucleoprotein D3